MSLDLGGLLGSSMRYSVHGEKIETDGDFKNLIYPLRDEEASRLIRESSEGHFVARIFFAAGALVGADVALLYKPVSFVRVDWIDRIATGATVAQFLAGAGILFNSNAEGLKFNAVQRYNRLVRTRAESGLDLSPQLACDGSRVDIGLGCAF